MNRISGVSFPQQLDQFLLIVHWPMTGWTVASTWWLGGKSMHMLLVHETNRARQAATGIMDSIHHRCRFVVWRSGKYPQDAHARRNASCIYNSLEVVRVPLPPAVHSLKLNRGSRSSHHPDSIQRTIAWTAQSRNADGCFTQGDFPFRKVFLLPPIRGRLRSQLLSRHQDRTQ